MRTGDRDGVAHAQGGQNCLFWTGDQGTLLYHNTELSNTELSAMVLSGRPLSRFGLTVAFHIPTQLGCDIQP